MCPLFLPTVSFLENKKEEQIERTKNSEEVSKKKRAKRIKVHPIQACPSVTGEARGITGKPLAEALRGITAGPKSCGQDVRN